MYRFRETTHGVTWRSKRSFDRHVHKLGRIFEVRGYIYTAKYGEEAAVLICGDAGTMRLSGLSWGYGGEGPRGLQYVLEKLNFNQDIIGKVISTPWMDQKPGVKWRISCDVPPLNRVA
jgi:hypothetical protein